MSNARKHTYMPPEIPAVLPGSSTFQARFRCLRRVLPLVLATAGCSPERADPAPTAVAASSASATSSASAAVSATAEPARGGRGDGSGGGQRGKRFGDAAVYADGKPLGVLRFFELPPGLVVRPQKLQDGREVPRYRIAEYLESVGIDLTKVKEVHLQGGRSRASIVPGSELRKFKNELLFSFTRGDGGKARVEWPDAQVDVNTTIDTIVSMSVYLELQPPRFDSKARVFLDEKGQRFEGVPYTKPEESLRGTRVYADGKLTGSVKRKRLTDSVLAKSYTPQKPRFSLDAYLASTGVDPSRITTLAVVRGDGLVARLDAAEWKKAREKAEFSLAPGSEGRILVHLPKADGSETTLPASALLTYVNAAPKRILDAKVAEEVPGSEENQAESD